jgi:hypothetical protein
MTEYIFKDGDQVVSLKPQFLSRIEYLELFCERHQRFPDSEEEWETFMTTIQSEIIQHSILNN